MSMLKTVSLQVLIDDLNKGTFGRSEEDDLSEIAYAINLTNLALNQNHSIPKLFELYQSLQNFAFTKIDEDPYNDPKKMSLTLIDGNYQQLLTDIIEKGLNLATQEQLPYFVDLYVQKTREYNELDSINRNEAQDAQHTFLLNARENFIETYLDPKVVKESNKNPVQNLSFNYSRFSAIIEYIVQSPDNPGSKELATPVLYQRRNFTLFSAPIEPMWDEIHESNPRKNRKDLNIFMNESLNAVNTSAQYSSLFRIAEKLPGCVEYHKSNNTTGRRIGEWFNTWVDEIDFGLGSITLNPKFKF
jgi:hypothetical protein